MGFAMPRVRREFVAAWLVFLFGNQILRLQPFQGLKSFFN